MKEKVLRSKRRLKHNIDFIFLLIIISWVVSIALYRMSEPIFIIVFSFGLLLTFLLLVLIPRYDDKVEQLRKYVNGRK